MTIKATVRPDGVSVLLEASGITDLSVTLYRVDAVGNVGIVRGSPFPVQGGGVTVIDHEVPFGTVTYATSDPPGADAVSVQLDVDTSWLTSTADPFLSLPVDVYDDREWRYPSRSYAYDVIGRAAPAYTWYRRSTRGGTVTLLYPDAATRDAILDALSSGAPVLMRYPLAGPYRSGYYAVEDVRVIPLVQGSDRGSIELDYVHVVAPPGTPQAAAGWAWQNVPGRYATWQALQAAFPKWRDVVAGPPQQPRTPSSGGFGA